MRQSVIMIRPIPHNMTMSQIHENSRRPIFLRSLQPSN